MLVLSHSLMKVVILPWSLSSNSAEALQTAWRPVGLTSGRPGVVGLYGAPVWVPSATYRRATWISNEVSVSLASFGLLPNQTYLVVLNVLEGVANDVKIGQGLHNYLVPLVMLWLLVLWSEEKDKSCYDFKRIKKRRKAVLTYCRILSDRMDVGEGRGGDEPRVGSHEVRNALFSLAVFRRVRDRHVLLHDFHVSPLVVGDREHLAFGVLGSLD